MNKQIKIASAALGLALVAGTALPVFAQATAPANTKIVKGAGKNDTAKIADFIKKADQEIARRVTSLNALSARIQAMKKVSDTQKSNLASTIQSQISILNTLKTKIDADTDLATVRTDVQSITKSYRIFMLVIPQGAVTAAADRALTITDTMTVIGTKLQTRISDAQTAGKNVASLSTLLTDYNAKISDAKTQAQAAINEVAALTPDNGDQTKMQSNTAALKDARAKIQAAQKDIVAAQKDARDIEKGLKAFSKTTQQ
jgi:DNA repair exonuclease SbcCD ATPase subunit